MVEIRVWGKESQSLSASHECDSEAPPRLTSVRSEYGDQPSLPGDHLSLRTARTGQIWSMIGLQHFYLATLVVNINTLSWFIKPSGDGSAVE